MVWGYVFKGGKWVMKTAISAAKKKAKTIKKKETRGRPSGSGPQQKQRIKDVKKAKKGTYTRSLDAHGNPKKVSDMTGKEWDAHYYAKKERQRHGKSGMGRVNGFTKGDEARYKVEKRRRKSKKKPLKF